MTNNVRPEPNFVPLVQLGKLVGGLDPDDFMWMVSVITPEGVTVEMYKHVMTRRYLSLDASGHAYDNSMTLIDLRHAMEWARCFDYRETEATGAFDYRADRD